MQKYMACACVPNSCLCVSCRDTTHSQVHSRFVSFYVILFDRCGAGLGNLLTLSRPPSHMRYTCVCVCLKFDTFKMRTLNGA